MAEPISEGQAPAAATRYQVAGDGKQLFTRADLRDRIRSGEIVMMTGVAMEGTDEFRPAGEFPELARYFSLLSSEHGVASASALVTPSTSLRSTTVVQRLLPGALYPFTGLGSLLVLGLAILELIPLGALINIVAIPLVGVAIVRVSSQGATVMPSWKDYGGPALILINAAKVFILSLLAAWPLILAVIFTFLAPRGAQTFFIAALVAATLYYPACIAILAKYGTIKPALSVTQIWGFITTLGSDYVVALLAGLGVLVVTVLSGITASLIGLPERLQGLAVMFAIVWGTLYVFHLIGWGMHHRRDAV